MKRETGYYWVKWHDITEWEIGLYDNDYDVWHILHKCYHEPIEEEDLILIDENRITKPNFLKFNIERSDLYEYDKPKDRTRKRLIEMAECGMEETGLGLFGYKGVMSGLYIENVWNYSDEDFKDYLDWVKDLIKNKIK